MKIINKNTPIYSNLFFTRTLKYPTLLTKSFGSLSLKMKYLRTRYQVNFKTDIDFPAILLFNYNETIRPRGEAMLKVLMARAQGFRLLST